MILFDLEWIFRERKYTMKIGEVLEKTGLTDRAVRLYIEHGLVTPSIEKSYSGRKSFVFSDEDVEKLRRISILRKADFSIAQIGRIDGGGEDAAAAFSEFMEYKREKHSADGEIIDALEKFSGDVTLESVAVALEVGGADKMENIDIIPTKAEVREKRIFTSIGAVIIVISSLWLLLMFLLSSDLVPHGFFRHPKIDLGVVLLHLLLSIPSVIAIWCGTFIIRQYRNVLKLNKKWTRRGEAIASLILVAILWTVPAQFQLFAAVLAPFTYSGTTDVDDYLVLDDEVMIRAADGINKIFPACVPNYAINSSTEYYYRYSIVFEEYDFEIFAQWTLPSEESYKNEKQRVLEMHPDKETFQKGDYTCVPIAGMKNGNWKDKTIMLFFAYNDETKTVRYIYRDDMNQGEPYFETLDW